MPPCLTDYAAVARKYADDVVGGKILACKWTRLACQRHIDDLNRAQADEDWSYEFDQKKAAHACKFIEQLPHTKGKWANKGERVKLQQWQIFILCSLFGWLKRGSHTRRFNLAFILVPRKNGKSLLAAAIGLYMLAADGEFGSEVYSGATSQFQAMEVFTPAKVMVERTAALRQAFGLVAGPQRIYIASNGSKFEPVIAKPGDGSSPHCAIVDEYHEHVDDMQFDTFRTGMGAREQPLLLVVSTAGDNMAGPCKLLQDDVEHVLEGSIERGDLFGIVYSIDADQVEWTSDDALRMANPNFDVSVSAEFLRSEQQTAITNPRKRGIFKTKHLNVWVGANSAYFDLEKWNELADPRLKPEDFIGCQCFEAVDLSSKKDIAARVKVFKKPFEGKDHYYVFGTYYLPDARAKLPEFQHYQGWVEQGYLQTTPGAVIDYDQITQDTIEDVNKFKILELAFDPWNAEQFAQTIAAKTSTIAIEIPQKVQYLSEPMKSLDALITDSTIHHDGNPVLAWMIGNVVAHTDKNENVYPNKSRDESKIDGAVALIMAAGRAITSKAQVKKQSVYATRGLRLL